MRIDQLPPTSRALLKLIAEDHVAGRKVHDLRDLAVRHGCPFQHIHGDIRDLRAVGVAAERLDHSDGSAMVRFHLPQAAAALVATIKGGANA